MSPMRWLSHQTKPKGRQWRVLWVCQLSKLLHLHDEPRWFQQEGQIKATDQPNHKSHVPPAAIHTLRQTESRHRTTVPALLVSDGIENRALWTVLGLHHVSRLQGKTRLHAKRKHIHTGKLSQVKQGQYRTYLSGLRSTNGPTHGQVRPILRLLSVSIVHRDQEPPHLVRPLTLP